MTQESLRSRRMVGLLLLIERERERGERENKGIPSVQIKVGVVC